MPKKAYVNAAIDKLKLQTRLDILDEQWGYMMFEACDNDRVAWEFERSVIKTDINGIEKYLSEARRLFNEEELKEMFLEFIAERDKHKMGKGL